MKKQVRHAYLISAYKNPEQVRRLISALNTDNAYFFLHIDRKFDDQPFRKTLSGLKNKIQYLEREAINWGGFEIVKVTINGFKTIREIGEFDYIHWKTAQDYPIKPTKAIENFFVEHYGKSFISYFPLSETPKIVRIKKYYWGNARIQSKARKHLLYYFNAFVGKTGFFKRKPPGEMKYFGGEGVMTLHKTAVEYILEYLEENPGLLNFHKYTFAPDEILFHTILLNASEDAMRNSLVNRDLYHIDWSKPGAAYYPITFGTEDFESIKNSDQLFARKFDIDFDSEILDLIDEKILFVNRENALKAIVK